MATLSGSLETLNLPDVLRLVASTGKSGLLHVEGPDVTGRLYFYEGELTYATTRSGHAFVDTDDGERRIVDVDRITEEQTADLLKQQVTDVLVRLAPLDSGSFEFEDGTMPSSDSGFRFDIEAVLEAAEERIREWDWITEVLPSTETEVRFNPQLTADDVTLDARSWAVIAALGVEGTANGVAQQLKIFEFAAAKKIAELIRRGLVAVAESWDDLPQNGLKLASEVAEEDAAEDDSDATDKDSKESTEEPARAEEPAVDESEESDDREPPPSELARRWRELSSARQRGDR
ncbi:MAG: DUF4388 domain-containing protein [Acidimicrobiia bacterium]